MIYKNFESLYERYDTFFVDVYGVLYNGRSFFDGALNLLKTIKDAGKKIIILSNTTLVSDVCKSRYGKKGLIQDVHYDEFISSGEAFRHAIKSLKTKSFYQIFLKNDAIFEGMGLIEEDSIEKADFIYVGSPNDKKCYTIDGLKTKNGEHINIEDMFDVSLDDIEGFEEIADCLKECKKHDKSFVVVNPDIFALEGVGENIRPILCQGAIGEFYKRMGGKVEYFGKPYPNIYDFAKSFTNNEEKIVMIGDTLWTDILGGNIAGIDTTLVLTGVSGEFLVNINEKDINLKMEKLKENISKKLTHKDLMQYSQTPTHIAESFA